jgi:hypothetical protein
MRRLVTLFAIVGIALLGHAATASAADPTHSVSQVTFPDTMCGFSGTSTWFAIDNYGTLPDGATYDSGRLQQTFVANNGRGVIISYDSGHLYNAPPVLNSNGTVTMVQKFTGLDVKTQAINGPVLQHGAGIVQLTWVLDSAGRVVSLSVVALAGNNPNLSGAPDCSVVGPYLAGA